MKILARNNEIKILEQFLDSNKSELMAVYGRRRVGKTYLIKNFFPEKDCKFFYVTGIEKGSYKVQRENFCRRLSEVFYNNAPLETPKDWHSVFALLNNTMKQLGNEKKIVIFFDEFPWMVTQKSQLLSVLEYYWNEYWSNQSNIKLIVCGSLASWIIKNLIHATGGLYQRVTYRLKIEPFKLNQAKEFLLGKGISLTNRQLTSLYMAFGGIPLYLEQAQKGLSADQIIDKTCFNVNGLLFDELKELFKSLFKDADIYIKITKEIAKYRHGISKDEIAKKLKITRGGRLSERLEELVDTGFIISFVPYQNVQRGEYFKIIDEYTLFYFNWIAQNTKSIKLLEKPSGYWMELTKTGTYQSWKGYAFESICYKHISNIQAALSLSPSTLAYSWRYSAKRNKNDQGVQIDLLFERKDDAITLCEIKFTDSPYVIDKKYASVLETKKSVFVERTATKKQIFLSIISANGLVKNKYSTELVDSIVTLDDLFL